MVSEELRQIAAFLAEAEPPETADEEEIAGLQDLHRLGERLSWLLDGVDGQAVPLSLFANLRTVLEGTRSQLEAYLSSDARAHLTNAASTLPGVYQAIGTFAAFLPSVDPERLAEAASSFRRSVGQLLRNVQDEAERVRRNLGQLRSDLENEKQRLETEIQAVEAQLAPLETRIEGDEARIDTAIQGFQTQFSSAQESHREEFTTLVGTSKDQLRDAIDDVARDAEEAQQTQSAEAAKTLAHLKEMDDEISKVYSAIADKAVAGAYLREATEQKADADRWRWIALGFGVAAVGVAIYVLVHASVSDVSIGTSVLKLASAVAFAGVAGFAGTQAAQHRRRERNARTIQMQLVSLDPYLARLPEDQRNDLKRRLALRIFNGGDEPGSDAGWERENDSEV
jgi:gas vesicle protein